MTPRYDVLTAYYDYCLRGDLQAAIKTIKPYATSRISTIKQFHEKISRRFIAQTESIHPRCRDPFVKAVITEYRKYYCSALLFPKQTKVAEVALEKEIRLLARSLEIKRCSKHSWTSLEQELKKEFEKRGYYSLWGKVSPLRSLLVWKKQKQKHFSIPLLLGKQTVKVILLKGFVELGWLHLITFGKHYVGGWANENALYCVVQAYKNNLKSEIFRVSYLTHEAQHFSDYKNFPAMSQVDLEYRAKLAELIAAKKTNRLIVKFKSEAKNDPHFPHCYASWKVLNDIDLPEAKNTHQQRAAFLLHQHTLRLKKNG